MGIVAQVGTWGLVDPSSPVSKADPAVCHSEEGYAEWIPENSAVAEECKPAVGILSHGGCQWVLLPLCLVPYLRRWPFMVIAQHLIWPSMAQGGNMMCRNGL